MLITFEGNVIKTCGFHRCIDDMRARKPMEKFESQVMVTMATRSMQNLLDCRSQMV